MGGIQQVTYTVGTGTIGYSEIIRLGPIAFKNLKDL